MRGGANVTSKSSGGAPAVSPGTAGGSGLARYLPWVALIGALLLAALFALFPDFDLDIWWHMRAGQMILAEGRIPHEDVFTYTATGRPWITHEWLAEVLFYLLHRLGGFDLLSFFRALLAAGALALGAWAGLAGSDHRADHPAGHDRQGHSPPGGHHWVRLPAAALGVILAAPMIGVRALARPHLLTAFFLGVTLLLLRLDSTRGERKWRLWLLPLFLVWANVHSGFVQGFMLIALYWIGEMLTGRLYGPLPSRTEGEGVQAATARPTGRLLTGLLGAGWRARALVFGLIIFVTLINPNHIHALLYPFRLAGRQEFTDIIVELRSILHPDYRGALFVLAFAASAAAILIFAGTARRRLNLALLLPAIVFGLLGVRFLRGVAEFAPLVPAFLAAHGAWLGRRRPVVVAASLSLVGLTLAGGAGVVKHGIPMGAAPNLRIGLGIDSHTCPTGAVRFIEASRLPGRVFNMMSFGSYMIHELWPEKQVYIDGRLEVFPPGFLREYRQMLDTGAGWTEAVDKYGISAAIVSYEEGPAGIRGLHTRLRGDPSWACVYFGENAIVYARRVPENEDVLQRFGSRFDPSMRSMESIDAFVTGASPEELEQAVSALREMTRITPEEKAAALALGLLLDRAGRPAEAVELLRQAVRADPRAGQARLLLVGALGRAGLFDEARAEIDAALRADPRSAEPLVVLAEIERSQGRLPEAIAALERALAREPKNYLIPLRLGALNGQMGRLDLARNYLNRALQLQPGDPAVLQNLETLRRVEADQRGQ